LADLGLTFQQISTKNIELPSIGLRPIWNLFFKKLKQKTYNFLYEPATDLGLIFQQILIKKCPSIGFRPIWGSFLKKYKYRT
jgi:hypothetical protein